jgi:hypothetical protein
LLNKQKEVDKVYSIDYNVYRTNKERRKTMIEELKKDPKVIDVEDMLKHWVKLTPMQKERAVGYMEGMESKGRMEPKTA